MTKTKKLFTMLAAIFALTIAPVEEAQAIEPATVVGVAAVGWVGYQAFRGDWDGTAFQSGGVPLDFNTKAGADFCQARLAKGEWLKWGGVFYDLTVGALLQNPTTQALNKRCEAIYWGEDMVAIRKGTPRPDNMPYPNLNKDGAKLSDAE